jgi:hypothetical protein
MDCIALCRFSFHSSWYGFDDFGISYLVIVTYLSCQVRIGSMDALDHILNAT